MNKAGTNIVLLYVLLVWNSEFCSLSAEGDSDTSGTDEALDMMENDPNIINPQNGKEYGKYLPTFTRKIKGSTIS